MQQVVGKYYCKILYCFVNTVKYYKMLSFSIDVGLWVRDLL